MFLADSVTSEGISTLDRLANLEEFLYDQYYRSDEVYLKKQKHFAMCLQVLPRIHVSCSRTKIHLSYQDYQLCDHVWKAFEQLQGRLPSRLGLRQLNFNEPSRMPMGVALPNLQTLTLINPAENFQLGSGLESVTELGLHGVSQQLLEQILGQIGHQLQKLAVYVWDILLLDRVFRMCPNLQSFFISDCPVINLGIETSVPPMSCLTELVLTKSPFDNRDWAALESDHLLQVLRAAPNLSILRMSSIDIFGEQAFEDFSEALEQHTILQQLETLGFYYDWLSGDEESVKWTCSVLRSMIKHCPKLTTLRTDDCWEY